MSSFDEWVKTEYPHLLKNQGQTLSLCMGFAKQGYEAGQHSRQKEIDELNLTIKRLITSEEDIARSCKHWRDSHRELDERIIKVLAMLEDEVIEVDYDEYRFVGNFVDADKLKEILK